MTGRETILVLDSDQDTLDTCRELFCGRYDVILCTESADALAGSTGREIAVVLVDQKVDGRNGLEFLLAFSKQHPASARIVMTAQAELDEIAGLINRSRIDAFVVKPWNPHQLVLAVDREVTAYARSREIDELNERIAAEHHDMLAVLRDLDPEFQVPSSTAELRLTQGRLRRRVAEEVERLVAAQGATNGGGEVPERDSDDNSIAVVIDSGSQARDEQIEEVAEGLSLHRAATPEDALRAPRVVVIKSDPVDLEVQDRRVTVLRLWEKGRRDRSDNPLSGRVHHLVSASSDEYRDLLGSTLSQLKTGKLPSLAELLGGSPEIVEVTARRSDERAACIEQFIQFAGRSKLTSRARIELSTSLDELFTNAIYNAPHEDGEYLSAATPRTTRVASPRPVRIQFGRTDQVLGVAVRDEYGSLDSEVIIGHLRRCFQTALVSPLDKSGGAGLGFFLVLLNASRMVLNIDPGKSTEVIVLRNLRERYRDFIRTAPTLNIFATAAGVELRRFARVNVNWPSFLSDRDGRRAVAIRDISENGAFVAGDLDRLPEIGAKVELIVEPEALPAPTRVRAVVRWRGRSLAHGCSGAGIEFMKSQPRLVPQNTKAALAH